MHRMMCCLRMMQTHDTAVQYIRADATRLDRHWRIDISARIGLWVPPAGAPGRVGGAHTRQKCLFEVHLQPGQFVWALVPLMAVLIRNARHQGGVV